MDTYNEQEAVQGVARRFAQSAEELNISGAQLFRDGIVSNEQVLSKIKNGWQKPSRKAIDLFCQKYGISAAWMYTGEGNQYLNRGTVIQQPKKEVKKGLLYHADFNTCIGSDGQFVSGLEGERFEFPMTGDIDFWCTNNDNSLEPLITPGDIIALKKLRNWKDYIPGKYICVVVTKDYKVLLKVSVTQNDPDSITFTQIDDGQPLECKISKDSILAIYQVVFRINRL